jgi:hypothetical protein
VFMRLALLSLVALTVAGCGAATTAPGSSSESPTLAQPTVSTEVDVPDLTPPPIFLVSAAGKQRAAEGSSCVEYTNPATGQSAGQCADVGGPVRPKAMTVVQPGDNVIVTIPGATLKKESSITIRPLGCADKETKTIELPASGELHWAVDLEPGAYELDVFALFELGDGLSGDTSGTLGLLVGGGPKESDYSGILGLDETLAVCPFQP